MIFPAVEELFRRSLLPVFWFCVLFFNTSLQTFMIEFTLNLAVSSNEDFLPVSVPLFKKSVARGQAPLLFTWLCLSLGLFSAHVCIGTHSTQTETLWLLHRKRLLDLCTGCVLQDRAELLN